MSNESFEHGYEEGYKAGFEAGQKISHDVADAQTGKLPFEISDGSFEVTQEFIDEYNLDDIEVGDIVKIIRDMYGNIIGILNG
jgi:hypothetical protein